MEPKDVIEILDENEKVVGNQIDEPSNSIVIAAKINIAIVTVVGEEILLEKDSVTLFIAN